MGKRYPIYTRKKGSKTVYVLDYGKIYDPTVDRVRRVQRQFSKRKDAENEKRNLIESSDTTGPSNALLSINERIDARAAIEILSGQASLVDAANYFTSSHRGTNQITINDAVNYWVDSKRSANRRHKTVLDAASRGAVLQELFGESLVSSVSKQKLLDWFDSECPAGSRKNYRTLFHGFWEYAVKQGWAIENIVKAIPAPAVERGEPHIFTVRQVIRLLRCCEIHCPDMIPYFAIGIYAGLRPENELANLNWENINLSKRMIRVTAATAKSRRKRIVNISDNLAAWLYSHELKAGKVFYSRRIADRIKGLAEIEWHPDIMRHSFGSYHLAYHNDVAFTSKQMGHSSADMVLNHYYALVEDRDCKRFWGVIPNKIRKQRIQERLYGGVRIARIA